VLIEHIDQRGIAIGILNFHPEFFFLTDDREIPNDLTLRGIGFVRILFFHVGVTTDFANQFIYQRKIFVVRHQCNEILLILGSHLEVLNKVLPVFTDVEQAVDCQIQVLAARTGEFIILIG